MFHVKRVKKRLISGNMAEQSLLSCENVLLCRAELADCKRLEMFVARGAGVVTKNAAPRLGGDCVGAEAGCVHGDERGESADKRKATGKMS